VMPSCGEFLAQESVAAEGADGLWMAGGDVFPNFGFADCGEHDDV